MLLSPFGGRVTSAARRVVFGGAAPLPSAVPAVPTFGEDKDIVIDISSVEGDKMDSSPQQQRAPIPSRLRAVPTQRRLQLEDIDICKVDSPPSSPALGTPPRPLSPWNCDPRLESLLQQSGGSLERFLDSSQAY